MADPLALLAGRLESGESDPRVAWRRIARPDQLLPESEYRVVYWVGGRGCIAAGTRVYLPLEGRHERVDMLAAAGQPVTVLALADAGPVPARTDGAPFVKGTAALHEVSTEDGRRVTVTGEHRFLTPRGWLRLADMRAGQLLAAGAPVQPRAASARRSAWPSGARRSTGTVAGSPGRYLRCPRCGGPLPPPAAAAGLPGLPSPAGAGARSRLLWPAGDPADASGCSRSRPRRSRPARSGSAPDAPSRRAGEGRAGSSSGEPSRPGSRTRRPSPGRISLRRAVPEAAARLSSSALPGRLISAAVSGRFSPLDPGCGLPRCAAGAELSGWPGRTASPGPTPAGPTRTAAAVPQAALPTRLYLRSAESPRLRLGGDVRSDRKCRACGQASTSTPRPRIRQRLLPRLPGSISAYADYTRWTRITAIRNAGTGVFYDLSVPGPANYLAEGLWHHNSGKTRASSQGLAELIGDAPEPADWGIVAPTYGAAWTTCVEGESGILAALGTTAGEVKQRISRSVDYAHRSYGEIGLKNGHKIYVDSADDGAIRVQGKNLSGLWASEIGLWVKWAVAWDESIAYAVRRGGSKIIADGTPKISRPAAQLVRRLLSGTEPGVVVRRLLTKDNLENLSETFFRSVVSRASGTRLERQELEGELLDDVDGALWSRDLLEEIQHAEPVPPGWLNVAYVGVDVSDGTDEGDEQAYTVAGIGPDHYMYVTESWGGREGPVAFLRRVVYAAQRWRAVVILEKNHGGAYLVATLRQVMEDLGVHVPVRVVHASASKTTRAEPAAALYERRVVRHANGPHTTLEDQLCTFTAGPGEKSPDRLDSLVWAAHPLLGYDFDFSPLPRRPAVRAWAGSPGNVLAPRRARHLRVADPLGRGRSVSWDVDSFAPAEDDGQGERANVKAWR